VKAEGGEAQCFLLNDWKMVGHIVVDYRLLLSWAPKAEALYATANIRRSTAEATAEIAKAAHVAALEREHAALEREQAAILRAEDERGRRVRVSWLAGGLGVVAVALGAVAFGVVVAR
jgi:hypothetical protein